MASHYKWYSEVAPGVPLSQGDLIHECPIVEWTPDPVIAPILRSQVEREDQLASEDGLVGLEAQELAEELSETYSAGVDSMFPDVVVMTQACDLENDKVTRVVLCGHIALSEHRSQWEEDMRARGGNPTSKAWDKHTQALRQGHLWNLHILNRDSESGLVVDHRVVDFNQVYSLPREFLEAWAVSGAARPRLNPPYREHLSQGFARYFMRVGLPEDISF